jgi:hypothetical protein
LRYEPVPTDNKSPFRKAPRFSNHATLRSKVNNAHEHGAAALILVDLHQGETDDGELIATSRSVARGANTLVAAQVKRQIIEPWLAQHGADLAALKQQIDSSGRPASRVLPGARASLTITLEEMRSRAENVIGYVAGSDTSLPAEHVVVGAHYDHLGYGHYGTRDGASQGNIHAGADDNASGAAVLLKVAEELAAAPRKPRRAVVFIAFSGEELGLHGSRYYTRNPSFPIAAATAMINLDMVGRLRENRLTVFGARAAKELSAIVSGEAAKLDLEIRESDSIGRSDNMSFYMKAVPALHFFTGTHADYHQPSDTWDKLNYEGMERIAALTRAVALRLANATEPLKFVEIPSRPMSAPAAEAPSFPTFLGSVPDYSGGDHGVKLAGVTPGSPAARAGLRPGDVITQFAGAKIANIEDLMGQLGSKKPGDEVEIAFLRAGQPLKVKAVLTARN